LATREVAIILALAKTSEPSSPPPAEVRKVRPTAAPPAAPAAVDPAKSTPDDCKVSPYYMDDRNIKVIRPECRRSISSQ
jgi:hypothetical protein